MLQLLKFILIGIVGIVYLALCFVFPVLALIGLFLIPNDAF